MECKLTQRPKKIRMAKYSTKTRMSGPSKYLSSLAIVVSSVEFFDYIVPFVLFGRRVYCCLYYLNMYVGFCRAVTEKSIDIYQSPSFD